MPADVARIAFAQREYRVRSILDATVETRHPLAATLDFLTLIRDAGDADLFGATVLGLRKLDRWTWACFVAAGAYPQIELGQTITIKYPRFGFTNGKNFIVKRVKRDSNSLYDELTLFGPQ